MDRAGSTRLLIEMKKATNGQLCLALAAGALMLALGIGADSLWSPIVSSPPEVELAVERGLVELPAGPFEGQMDGPSRREISILFDGASGDAEPAAASAPDEEASPETGAPIRLSDHATPEESVVLSEVQYHPSGGDAREEWIEIHNRGSRPAVISGWKLAEAVEFTFPEETTLPPGGFLVVCSDPERAREALGIPEALGGWTGDLSDAGERIRLLNASGKEVESFAYDDRDRFSILPDGTGRSLERRDPHSSAAFPGNWGPSSSSAGNGWRRVVASGKVPSNRFYLYLLGEGTVFVDDIIVRAGGRPGPVFSEGFEGRPSGFSMNGNHSASRITSERARSGKRCLRIDAEGAGASSRNSVTVDGLELSSGEGVQLEFWAYLPSVSAPLVARFSGGRGGAGQRAGSTGLSVEVQAEGRGCTPGRKNSLHAAALPPFIHPVSHAPAEPGPRDEVVVSATVFAAVEPREVVLKVDDGSARSDGERSVSMVAGAEVVSPGSPPGRVYSAKLGAYPRGSLVRYRVAAEDRAAGKGQFPFEESPTRALGFHVEDGAQRSSVPVYRLFVSAKDLGEMESNPYSDSYRPATFVHGGTVYCDVGVRFRGQTSRFIPKKHWKVKFNKDRPFTTPSPGRYQARSINLNSFYGDGTCLREMLGYRLWRDMGHPYLETRHVRLLLNGSYHGFFLEMEAPNEDFLSRNGDPGGWLWKSYSDAHGPGTFELEAGDPRSAEAVLGDFLQNMNRLSGDALDRYIREHMEVDSFLDFLAGSQLIHSADHVQKNYLVRANAGGRFTFLPWDMDLTHGRNYECDGGGIWNNRIRHDHWDPQYRDQKLLFGTRAHPKCDGFYNGIIEAFLARSPSFRPLYYRRLAEHLAHYYHPDILLPKVERLKAAIAEEARLDRERWERSGRGGPFRREGGFEEAIGELVQWTHRRHEHLRQKLEALGYPVGKPLNASFEAAVQEGQAPLPVAFKNLSVGAIQSCLWDFGDGEKSSDGEPTHTYSKPGRYDVTLKVIAAGDAHTALRRRLIKVLPGPFATAD